MTTYWIGSIKVEVNNINEAKDLSEHLTEVAKEAGMDLDKKLSDFCFSVDADYQKHHNLDVDNWDVVHKS